jgi:lipoprotein-releasing system ATP-binding protein
MSNIENIVLEAVELSKTLNSPAGDVPALKNFSAQFKAQRSYALVGPSGCGKSTLLYLLGLLDTPTTGEILIEGRPTSNLSAKELSGFRNRFLGFVFQFHFLLPELTVMENIIAPALKRGTSFDEAAVRADVLLKTIGLKEKSLRMAYQLSGGEQQRVAVARALINEPRVVLADEPTGNLDSQNSVMVFDLLKDACKSRGATLVMVTHNRELATLCDETIPLIDGHRA